MRENNIIHIYPYYAILNITISCARKIITNSTGHQIWSSTYQIKDNLIIYNFYVNDKIKLDHINTWINYSLTGT
jgi:hypothetical protein